LEKQNVLEPIYHLSFGKKLLQSCGYQNIKARCEDFSSFDGGNFTKRTTGKKKFFAVLKGFEKK